MARTSSRARWRGRWARPRARPGWRAAGRGRRHRSAAGPPPACRPPGRRRRGVRWRPGRRRGTPRRSAGCGPRARHRPRTRRAPGAPPRPGVRRAAWSSVMPVSAVTAGSTGAGASTKVWNVPRHSPARNRAAPTSVMAQVAAEAPVVSRSTTQNVTSWSGVASSSTVRSIGRRVANVHSCGQAFAAPCAPGRTPVSGSRAPSRVVGRLRSWPSATAAPPVGTSPGSTW